MYRTVELTCRTTDLAEVLGKLKTTEKFKKDAAFTLQVDIEDCKENYETLCKLEIILDWKLLGEAKHLNKNEDVKKSKLDEEGCGECSKCEGGEKMNLEVEKARVISILKDSLPNAITTTDISNLLVSVWANIKNKKSKLDKGCETGIKKFSSLFFKNYVVPYILERRKDPDNTLWAMTLFIETFYEKLPTVDILSDIIDRICKYWNTIAEMDNFQNIAGVLFGPSEEVRKALGL